MAILALIAGLALLIAGAESLVRGASSLARRLGISSLVVGLTVVAWGTSAPELATSIQSALNGETPLSMGNVVGSNIFNVLVIIGICGIIAPLAISLQIIRVEVPIMIGFSLMALVMAADGRISLTESIILIGAMVAYTILQGRLARNDQVREAAVSPRGAIWADILYVIVGLIVLVIGARLLVTGAVTIARTLGIGAEIIGLTIIAAGTSLPEVATSVAATLRGERDIAIGNIVGSNIFNIVGVLGISSLSVMGDFTFDAVANLPDFAIMLAAAVVMLPICVSGLEISRAEGTLLLVAYVAYLGLLVMRVLNPASAPGANAAIIAGAVLLPTCAVLLSVLEKPGPTARKRA